eukprot:10991658-Lingulodinium_polyedra.AAC.1
MLHGTSALLGRKALQIGQTCSIPLEVAARPALFGQDNLAKQRRRPLLAEPVQRPVLALLQRVVARAPR